MALTWLHHLLPKSPMWRNGAPVRALFDGVQAWFDDARETFDLALLDLLPGETRNVNERLTRLGISSRFLTYLSDDDARALLDAIDRRSIGQAAGRLQDILQAAGFDVYVHEWFEPGTGPTWTERDPTPYVEPALSGLMHCDDDDANCGSSIAYCDDYVYDGGNWLTNESVLPRTQRPFPTSGYRKLFYVGGQTFGDLAEINGHKKELLKYLIIRFKRSGHWGILLADYQYPLYTEDVDELITEDEIPIYA